MPLPLTLSFRIPQAITHFLIMFLAFYNLPLVSRFEYKNTKITHCHVLNYTNVVLNLTLHFCCTSHSCYIYNLLINKQIFLVGPLYKLSVLLFYSRLIMVLK